MALSSTVDLAIAELVIYLFITPAVVLLMFKHRLIGLLGWAYLTIFCVLRITTDGILIADRNKPTSSTGAILNSIGVSPLLLALAGLLHEGSHYLTSTNRVLTVIFQVGIHLLAVGGIAIAATGGSKLAKPETNSNSYSSDHNLRKVGSCMLLLVWILLYLYAIDIHRRSKRQSRNATSADGRKLFMGNIIAIPFVGARTVYGVVYSFDYSRDVQPTTGSFAVKFVLIFLVQLLAVACFIIGGFLSRRIASQKSPVGPAYQLAPSRSTREGK